MYEGFPIVCYQRSELQSAAETIVRFLGRGVVLHYSEGRDKHQCGYCLRWFAHDEVCPDRDGAGDVLICRRCNAYRTYDIPDMPNSMRFWRQNSIEGIKSILSCAPYPYPDPETMEYYIQNRRELEILEKQERKVKARYERIKALSVKQAIE
jgi:hypothetical protein